MGILKRLFGRKGASSEKRCNECGEVLPKHMAWCPRKQAEDSRPPEGQSPSNVSGGFCQVEVG